MAEPTPKEKTLTQRLDSLYEFDREPVTENKLQGPRRFIPLYAGEHVAATEFVIGALFVAHGVSASDLLWGLLIGNLLAVLSWTFICAPIATRVRLTLYWYLRKLFGPGMTLIYNSANAFLYCILAGAMISVSATAIGVAFDMPSPTGFFPNSVTYVVITLCVGMVVTVVAILGFEQLSKFSAVCVPWMFTVFIGGAIALLPRFAEIHSMGDLWDMFNNKIWTGVPSPDRMKYTIWHIMFFAWFANLAMHIGLSDMAILRYAKKWQYGLFSAFGMYPGHYLAWVCSGIMMAAVAREMNPGLMAYEAAGIAGAVAVVVAGWTTANPTMYRAGLALQIVTPNWARWRITFIAGTITTIVSCFPGIFLRLLDFVALYGLILMPVGAVVFAEHWIVPRLGYSNDRVEKRKEYLYWPAMLTWFITLLSCYVINWLGLGLFFLWLPGWFLAILVYLLLVTLVEKSKAPAVQSA